MKTQIRPIIKEMIRQGCSKFVIVSTIGGYVTPDEAELINKHENKLEKLRIKTKYE